MAYEFKKLGEVEALDEVPEGANALIEVDGAIKRVPGSNLGGGGIPTAILRLNMDSGEADPVSTLSLENLSAGVSTLAGVATVYTATCDNMTYDEAKAILLAGEPLLMMMMMDNPSGVNLYATYPADGCCFVPACTLYESEIILIQFTLGGVNILCWFPDGTITSDLSYGSES